jgi:hypothetical protein
VSAYLSHLDERDRFVIKATYEELSMVRVQYMVLDKEGAKKLKAALDDALREMRDGPAPSLTRRSADGAGPLGLE